jgi:hypothetical protein
MTYALLGLRGVACGVRLLMTAKIVRDAEHS